MFLTHQLSSLFLIPALGIFVLSTLSDRTQEDQSNVKKTAIWTSLANLVLSISFFLIVYTHPETGRFIQKSPYSILGMHLTLAMDGLSSSIVVLTCLLTFLTSLFYSPQKENIKWFWCLMLLLQCSTLGAFLAADILFFFICFEVSLIPAFFMLNIFGDDDKTCASFQFFLYTLLGSFGLLISLIYLYQSVGSFDYQTIRAHTFLFQEELFLWLGFFIAFAIKIPLVPFHTWLPKTYRSSPTNLSVMLSGVLSTLGAYGLLKFMYPFFPHASLFFKPFACTLASFSIIYASFAAFKQQDAKKMIAYASVAHMGIVALGIFANDYYAFLGAAFQMVSHALISAGLFFITGILYQRYKTFDLNKFGKIAQTSPLYATCGMILMLAGVSLPGTAGFVGEIYVFLGAFAHAPTAVILAVSSLIFSAMYFLNFYRCIFFSNDSQTEQLPQTIGLEKSHAFILLALSGLIIMLGFFPHFLTTVLTEPTKDLTIAPQLTTHI